MRPIQDFETRIETLLTPLWKQAAAKARTKVAAKPESERSDAINDKASIWRGAKSALRQLSNHKCWYCETPVVRNDGAVDHYRPKNQVKDFPSGIIVQVTDASGQKKEHPGYWWLAFEPSNFRFCCQHCNEIRKDEETDSSGGKSSFFPVFSEIRRVSGPCTPQDLEDETALLLDPVVPADTALISFDRTGKAVPADTQNSWCTRRAEASIRIYHLYQGELEKARELVDRDVELKVQQAQRHYQYLNANQADLSAHDTFRTALKELKSMIDDDAPYSRQARATLRTFRYFPWVETLL